MVCGTDRPSLPGILKMIELEDFSSQNVNRNRNTWRTGTWSSLDFLLQVRIEPVWTLHDPQTVWRWDLWYHCDVGLFSAWLVTACEIRNWRNPGYWRRLKINFRVVFYDEIHRNHMVPHLFWYNENVLGLRSCALALCIRCRTSSCILRRSVSFFKKNTLLSSSRGL